MTAQQAFAILTTYNCPHVAHILLFLPTVRLALLLLLSTSLLLIEGSAVAGKVRTAKTGAQVAKIRKAAVKKAAVKKAAVKKATTQHAHRARTARVRSGSKLRSARVIKKQRLGIEVSPRMRALKALAHKDLPRSLSAKNWKHLTWKQVERDVRLRIENPNLIDQGRQELCGPAATLNAIASTDPRQYISLVKEVYESGTFRGKAIPKGLMERKPTTVQPTDWMMLTALRSVNGRPGQRGQHGVSIHSGSLPFELKSWLRKAGFSDVRSKLNLLTARSYKQIPHINKTMAKAESNVTILFVRGGFSQFSHEPGKAPTTMDKIKTAVPIHYVRLLTPITKTGEKISFSVFDHGKKRDYNITEKEFGRGVVGAITGIR